jgi:DNA-directed RNA polymerase subunit RPC12/RpoP
MTIIFHCSHCNKKVEAQDSAAGKWAKCPACHNKIYVPDIKADDELKLAPIDESEEERKKRLMAETYQLTQDILQEREIPEAETGTGWSAPEINDKELTKNIIVYLRQMADGELDEAQKIVNSIVPYRSKAIKILDKIALTEMPEPELADIPPQVLSGLIRNLRTRIS